MNTNSKLFTIDFTNIKGAIVSAIVVGILAVLLSVYNSGDIFTIDWKMTVNAGVLAAIGSILKNLFTNDTGSFAGITQVK